MAYVSIEGLTKTFTGKSPTNVIKGLDLDVQDGEFVVLLGPSGCGKTTTLRCLAGLEIPDEGKISLGGRTVFDAARQVNLAPDKRSIGMVFQSYALWPHMTVHRNIAYPLRARGLKDKIKEGWVEEIARRVDCEPLLRRYPAQLSGGQQQRVALARALVARPDLILLDEPLSNLDARLRESVRTQLHELHSRIRFTAIFVTHDQSEALALGDRLAIMRAGVIEQFDTPQHVFDRPATEYVAAFVGMSTRVVCERRAGDWLCNGEIPTGEPLVLPGLEDRGTVHLRLRPDDLSLAPGGEIPGPGTTVLAGRVEDAEYGGRHMSVAVSVGGSRLHALVPAGGWDSWERKLERGQEVSVGFRAADARCFDGPGTPHRPVEV
ncbi:MAG: ABC transporter ATP-binding protein [Actinomadura sp.]